MQQSASSLFKSSLVLVAIIPLKERVVDRFYDPVRNLFRVFGSGG